MCKYKINVLKKGVVSITVKLNEVYQMDNLKLLREMDDESVDLIYCDILYNTGRKFRDYDDVLGTPQEAVEWYRPRLIEMKRVLKDTGKVTLQCDYRLVHYLKVEMDSIFGIENFINDIIWYYKSPSPSSNKRLSCKHDNILCYSKTQKYRLNIDEIRGEYAKSTQKQEKDGAIAFGKVTKLNPKGKAPIDVWEISTLNSMAKERVGYDTQKPKKLLEKLIKCFSNKGDTVVDLFCGSGTTGVVAKELGRSYILCDIGEKAVEISKQRLSEV